MPTPTAALALVLVLAGLHRTLAGLLVLPAACDALACPKFFVAASYFPSSALAVQADTARGGCEADGITGLAKPPPPRPK